MRGGLAIGLLALILIGIYVVPQLYPPAEEPEADLATRLADQTSTFPTINDQSCNGASELVSNTATILQDMDGTLGTGFGRVVQFDPSNCDIVVQFLPILGSYNLLVRDSKTLDRNNSTSVRQFYIDAFLLSSDFVIINDYAAYKIAFKSTGEMNDALKLGKLRSLCGDECYRAVLSGIHWAIRVYMNEYLCDFENWAGQYVQLADRSC